MRGRGREVFGKHPAATRGGARATGGNIETAYKGIAAAFATWVDYDGHGAAAGDTYIATTVQDANRPADPNRPDNASTQTLERITAYATFDAADPSRMVIVATNKDINSALNVGFSITHPQRFTTLERYQVTWANGAVAAINGPTKVVGTIPFTGTNAFTVSLPAQSITVLVLKP
ncbi:hypothetical protein [Geothrix sp. PMB-07]|uniref:hypothetical protein n=1 Tax=Geothrix sp. PMB-07 TaxID=3068640 RepID=UPI002740D6AE|nr:hypothetical protein [Geothrix sp. PMB-07]WLT32377.1 hypothetical protein Q9293_03385 [Geothrix sp. PMB-07]